MALSGTINGTCKANDGASSKYQYKIEWSATQNTSANTSRITATAYVRATGSPYGTSTNWTSKLEGSTVKTFNYHIGYYGGSETNWVNFGSKSWTVNHNSDGTCKVTIDGSFSGTYNGSYALRSGRASQQVTLNTIPRASSFSMSSTDMTAGSSTSTVTINRASSSFRHKVYYKFGSINRLVLDTTSSATSLTITPSLNDVRQIPNSASGTGTIVVDTYNGSSKIGTASKSFTLRVPSSVVPTISSLAISDKHGDIGGQLVAGKSQVTLNISGENGSYDSSIKSRSISGHQLTSSADTAKTGVLSAGTHTYTATVTDSRGRKASKTTSITVNSYSNPWISNVRAVRCNSSWGQDDNGTYVRVYWQHGITPVNNYNGKQYKVSWAAIGSATWNVLQDWTNLTNYSDNSPYQNLGGNWLTNTSYQIKVEIRDSNTAVSATTIVGTSKIVMNYEKDGVGVGKFHERGWLDVAGDIYANGKRVLVADHPTGGNYFKGIPFVGGDGVMEIGKYLDFHDTNTTTADYTARITNYGSKLVFSGEIESNGILLKPNTSVNFAPGGDHMYIHGSHSDGVARLQFVVGADSNDCFQFIHRDWEAGSVEKMRIEKAYSWFNNSVLPWSDGGHSLGNPSYKWHTVHTKMVQFNNNDYILYNDHRDHSSGEVTSFWMLVADGDTSNTGNKGRKVEIGVVNPTSGNTTSASVQTFIASADGDHWLRLKNDGTATWAGKSILSTLSLADNDVIETRAIAEPINTASLISQGSAKSILVKRNAVESVDDTPEILPLLRTFEAPVEYITLDVNSMPDILKDSETGELDFGSTVAVLWSTCQSQDAKIKELENELALVKQHLGL